MPPDDESRTAGSSSSSKPHLASTYRLPQSHIPDRLRMGDDEHEDMTAPPAGTAGRGGRAPYMHQSVFSMIAAASSKNDFHNRFDESSDAEDEDADAARLSKDRFLSNDGVDGRRDGSASTSHLLNIAKRDKSSVPNAVEDRGRPHHRKRLSENKFLKSLAKLPHRGNKGKVPAPEPEPELDPTVTSEPSSTKAVRLVAATEAPVLSRMLDAQSRFGESEPLLNPTELPGKPCCQRKELSPSSLLSARLMDIFGFDRPEKVISEYQCWLLQSVLLQGYMYITEKHISFYAYLPKKPHTIIKSGYLSKRGRQNPKYNRYWVALKEDVLSYYMDPSNLYFPSGHVDLRYGISANLAEQKDKDKDTDNNVKDFTITTNNRIYQFRADSATSAREWVKTLQKVIFRSHNDGDSVKISLPIENVIDIEENPVIDFAHTFKIRVVESGESYAIDEYFFSFFECGKEAIEVLKKMANHTPAQHIQQAMLAPDGGHISGCRRSHSVDVISHSSTHETTLLAEAVKATLRPLSPLDSQYGSPKQSQDLPRSHFRTFSRGRRLHSRECSEAGLEQKRSDSTNRASVGDNQDERSAGGKLQNSSDSFVQSLEHATESSAILQSTSGTVESASQILNRSDVFRSPTIHRLQNSLSGSGEAPRRHSEDTARFPPTSADLLPLRTQTTQSLMKQAQQDAGSDSEHDFQLRSVAPSASSPTLQELMKAGSYPLQRAAGFAGYLRNRSKHMSNLLATESMGYFEKVSGMWIGGKRHYGDGETILSEDKMVDPEDEEQGCEHGDRFRTHFALPPSEKLQATYFAYLHRVIPLYASSKFRGWIDDLLSSAWTSCQNSDILIESPSAMAGIHIAEALGIPYFRAFTMPWTRTRAYPHAFAVPEHKMGGAYNYITYVMFDNVFWKAIAGQVNRWRKRELGLRSTNLDKMQPNKVPFLYNFSPSVVPPPLDFCDWIRVTGYWFLDEGANWQPPVELENFIKQARADEKKIVYIGFGSIVVSDPAALTKTVVDSVLRADVRCILSKGWSDRLGDPSSAKAEIPLPPEIHQIKSAPHDWLFSQIDAAAHHGGAGTTGASLRAGIPTIIKPFFGDQFFFGSRVEDLGVGICMKRLNVSVFSRALWEATHSERIIVKAKTLGEQIRKEDGVATAIQAIYRDLEYAKTLVRQRSPTTSAPQTAIYAVSNEESAAMISSETGPDDDGDGEDDADADAAMEDSWTFVGDETETDVTKKTRARERDYDIGLDNVATAGVINGSGGCGSDSGKG
ncbi:UDP-glucose:sterol glycosyltransferase [Histoplasma capsulatum]|uniref:Sterol 3-beta-glucosyltransferase n=1 Tax=Ajellomyces capsulatus TaxID=5037 RepID=A0A8A1MC31_AJECA|nr:UDP-glucose:sterol glycosyltransferase [Histoplasma capsulatum]